MSSWATPMRGGSTGLTSAIKAMHADDQVRLFADGIGCSLSGPSVCRIVSQNTDSEPISLGFREFRPPLEDCVRGKRRA
jgi:hypothetical protein